MKVKKTYVLILIMIMLVNFAVPVHATETATTATPDKALFLIIAILSGMNFADITHDWESITDHIDNMPTDLKTQFDAEVAANDGSMTIDATDYIAFQNYMKQVYSLDSLNIGDTQTYTDYPTVGITSPDGVMNVPVVTDVLNNTNDGFTVSFTGLQIRNWVQNVNLDFLQYGDNALQMTYSDGGYTEGSYIKYIYLSFGQGETISPYDGYKIQWFAKSTSIEDCYDDFLYYKLPVVLRTANEADGIHVYLGLDFNVVTDALDGMNIYNVTTDYSDIESYLYYKYQDNSIGWYTPTTSSSLVDEIEVGHIDLNGVCSANTPSDLVPILTSMYNSEPMMTVLDWYEKTAAYDVPEGETDITIPYVTDLSNDLVEYQELDGATVMDTGIPEVINLTNTASLDISTRYGISFLTNAFERLYVLRNADAVTPIVVTFDMRGIWNALGNLSSFSATYPFDSDEMTLIDLLYLDQWMFLGVSVRSYLRGIIASVMYLSTGLWLLSRLRKAE